MWAALWLACGRDPRPAPVDASAARVIDLRREPFAALRVPPDTLGGREAPTARIPLDDGWRYAGRTRSGGRRTGRLRLREEWAPSP